MGIIKDFLRKIKEIFSPAKQPTPTGVSDPETRTSSEEKGNTSPENPNHGRNNFLLSFIERLQQQKKHISKVKYPEFSVLDSQMARIRDLQRNRMRHVHAEAVLDFMNPFDYDFSELNRTMIGSSTLARFNVREEEKRKRKLQLKMEIESDLQKLEQANRDSILDLADRLIKKLIISIDESETDFLKRLHAARTKYFRNVQETERIRREAQQRELEESKRRRDEVLKLKTEKEKQEQRAFRSKLFESETEYHYEVMSKAGSLTLSDVIDSRRDFGLYDELVRGLALLPGDEHLRQYLYSFGKAHAEKLRQAFKSFVCPDMPARDLEILEVFDWGCGQGIGTLALIDRLRVFHKKHQNIRSVTLIEPGLAALRRGALNVSLALGDQQRVNPVNKYIDTHIGSENLKSTKEATKIHIFSNIIDVDGFNPDTVAEFITQYSRGVNYIVCLGPLFNDSHMDISKDRKIDDFADAFKYHNDFEVLSFHEDGPGWIDGRNWTRKQYNLRVTIS
jgi:hypothetical protein